MNRTLLIFVMILELGSARVAWSAPDIGRRGFLASLGGLTAALVIAEDLLTSIPTNGAGPAVISQTVDLGMYDQMIFNEGYATLIQFIIDRHIEIGLKGVLFIPNWRSFLGIGGWLKFYTDFQSQFPPEARFSFASDKAFIAQTQEMLIENASIQHLFQRAFAEAPVPTLNLEGLAHLSVGFLRQRSQEERSNTWLAYWEQVLFSSLRAVDPERDTARMKQQRAELAKTADQLRQSTDPVVAHVIAHNDFARRSFYRDDPSPVFEMIEGIPKMSSGSISTGLRRVTTTVTDALVKLVGRELRMPPAMHEPSACEQLISEEPSRDSE